MKNLKKIFILFITLLITIFIIHFRLINNTINDEYERNDLPHQLITDVNDLDFYKGAIIYNQVFFPEDIETKMTLLNNLNKKEKYIYTKVINIWNKLSNHMKINLELPSDLNEGKHAFITLGYKLNDDGSMHDILIQRLEKTLEVARDTRYMDSSIIVSGGDTAVDISNTEADLMAEWLIKNGVKKQRIIIENQSTNTVENASNTLDIAYKHKIDTITLISSPTHLRRAMIVYEASSLTKAEELNITTPIILKENLSYYDKEYEKSLNSLNKYESDEIGRDVAQIFEIYNNSYRQYRAGINSILLNANGAEGKSLNLKTNIHNIVKIPSNDLTLFKFEGKVFNGWGSESNGGIIYQPGKIVYLKPGSVLFAQWKTVKKQTQSIKKTDDFELIRKYPNDNFIIENDIQFKQDFYPIGVFNGKIDGQNH